MISDDSGKGKQERQIEEKERFRSVKPEYINGSYKVKNLTFLLLYRSHLV